MNIEFIIGTIIGVIGIIPIIISVVFSMKKPDLSKLMNRLVDKEISQKERQKVLRRMDRRLLLSNRRLTKEYIEHFSLGKKGKEAVFEEMCLQNHIEPTPEFCRMLLKVDAPAIRSRCEPYFSECVEAKTHIEAEKVISEKENETRIAQLTKKVTGKRQVVYMSELLRERHPSTCRQLTELLEKHHIPFSFLKATKDIWCRDFMPVQTASGKLVQFRYEPSYLKGKVEWERSRSDVREVCRANGLHPIFSKINLDGGNVLVCGGRAIVSDRVFSENPDWERATLLAELQQLLEAEIIVIPAQNDDMTGHSDGMVRFVDENTLLGNNRKEEYKYWVKGMNEVLEKYRLKYEDVPFFWDYKDPKHPRHAIGIYVNYLEIGNLIILPVFGVPGNKDTEVVKRFQEIFPDRLIETINYNEIALEGGLLNCTTWTIYE